MTNKPESAYYEDRKMAIIYFFVNGILLSLVGFAQPGTAELASQIKLPS